MKKDKSAKQANVVERKAVSPDKMISIFDTKNVKIRLVSTFGETALDEVIYALARQKIRKEIAENP